MHHGRMEKGNAPTKLLAGWYDVFFILQDSRLHTGKMRSCIQHTCITASSTLLLVLLRKKLILVFLLTCHNFMSSGAMFCANVQDSDTQNLTITPTKAPLLVKGHLTSIFVTLIVKVVARSLLGMRFLMKLITLRTIVRLAPKSHTLLACLLNMHLNRILLQCQHSWLFIRLRLKRR